MQIWDPKLANIHQGQALRQAFSPPSAFISLRTLANFFPTFFMSLQRVRMTRRCFTGKYTTRKIHTKLHPGPEWCIFHILTAEDIDDVIFRFFTAVYVWVIVKKNITR